MVSGVDELLLYRCRATQAAAGIARCNAAPPRTVAAVNWDAADYAFAGTLIAAVALAYGLAMRRTASRAYRAAVALALAAAFMIIWINAAVGIVGSEDNPVNWMYEGVIGLAIVGALFARFRPEGMARALVATAIAQVIVAVLPLFAGWGATGLITLVFAAMWLASARLFRQAARERA